MATNSSSSSTTMVAKTLLVLVLFMAIVCHIHASPSCSADGDCWQQCPSGQYAGCWFFGEMGGDGTCHCFYSHEWAIGKITCADCP